MGRKGLLIDYEYCSGCHTCEVACQMEKGLPADQWGIKLAQIGPWKIGEDNYQYSFIPIPTDMCDLCASRVAKGKHPTCVKHCMSHAISYGEIADLAPKMEAKRKLVTFALDW